MKWLLKMFDAVLSIFDPLFKWLQIRETEKTKRFLLGCLTTIVVVGIIGFVVLKLLCFLGGNHV